MLPESTTMLTLTPNQIEAAQIGTVRTSVDLKAYSTHSGYVYRLPFSIPLGLLKWQAACHVALKRVRMKL